MSKYIAPDLDKSAYSCPSCGVIAQQHKYAMRYVQPGTGWDDISNSSYIVCTHCRNPQIWLDGTMIFPDAGNEPVANSDLPEYIRVDYNEARSIVNKSPRGAAALLRLAIQKLCKHLGESGTNINNDIASLVKKGLPVMIQRALDILRVIGNEAVHPGTMDISDNLEVAQKLFHLVNLIADAMITQPKEVDALFESLPEDKREGIQQRDKGVR